MTHYLKHLFELYLSYMKLALIGLGTSSVLLITYAAFKANNLQIGFSIALIALGALLFWRYYKRTDTKISAIHGDAQIWASFKNYGTSEVSESSESIKERFEQRLEEAKQYLKLSKEGLITPAKVEYLEDGRLLRELMILVNQLEALDASHFQVYLAIEKFVALQETLGNKSDLSAVRKEVFDSLKDSLGTHEKRKVQEEESKVAG